MALIKKCNAMPIKWKVYQFACWYYLFWLVLVLCTGVYLIVSDDDQSYGKYWTLLFPLVMIVKPVLGLKFIRHLKSGTFYTKNGFILFSLFFLFNIIFTFYVAVGFCLAVAQESKMNWNDGWYTLQIVASFLFILSSGYFMRFDMRLSRLVHKMRFDDINSIGLQQSNP